ncbi:hypothetical protein HC02_28975 [Vibrio parahaemolyticus]|nr:hypothetical protein HC02_28975 [Vibrio parahaemolyticus]
MGVMAFEKEKIEQLGRCYAALDLLEVHNQTLHATQKALTEQMELHERLISIGLDYLSVEPLIFALYVQLLIHLQGNL